MRRVPFIALLALSACGREVQSEPPPPDRFYFPTGIAHVSDPANPTGEGRLFVANSDFDRRWTLGSVSAVDLNAYGLPVLNAGSLAPTEGPKQIPALNLAQSQQVYISPLAGQMVAYQGAEGIRLVVPTRAEGDNLFAIDVNGTTLSCHGATDTNQRDCSGFGQSLTAPALEGAEGYSAGKPRAPHPYGLALDPRNGELMLTHLEMADSPAGSRENRSSYVVRTNAATLDIGPQSYIGIGEQPANSAALGARFAYLTGRLAIATQAVPVMRLADRVEPGRIVQAGIDGAFPVRQARGVAVYPDPTAPGSGEVTVETQLFILGRQPDVLLVVAVEDALSDTPRLRLVKSVPLPAGPNQIRVIPRDSGTGALLAITCTDADSLALYDTQTPDTLATVLSNVGEQPFDIAVRVREGEGLNEADSARLFVTNFGDGRVAVVDVPNVNAPYNAFVSAHLGPSQVCLVRPDEPGCPEVSP